MAKITLDDKDFNKGMEGAVNQGKEASNSFKTIGGKIAKVMGEAFAVKKMVDFGKKSVMLASNLQEVQNIVDTAFGKDAPRIDKWAKDAAEAFGLSELQAKKFSGTMGAMLRSSGLTGEKVYELSTNMTGLAADFASFYNIDHETAFMKIRSGISGETEPLKELGINMSVANLQAYALAKGIEKPYAKMSQSEQTLLRYNYLMSVSSDAQGDFARTSDSFANQLRILKMKLESAGGALGEKLLPPLTKLLTWITENLDGIIKFVSVIGTMFAIFKSYTIINSVVKAFTTFKAAIQGVTIAQTALNAVMALNPITLLIMAITALVGAFIYLWNTNEDFKQFWIDAWNKIKEVAIDSWNAISSFFTETIPETVDNIKEWFAGLPEWFSQLGEDIKNFFIEKWNQIVSFFTETIPEWINSIGEWFGELPYKIGFAIGQAAANIYQWGSDVWNYLITNVPLWIEGVGNWFAELPGKIWNWLVQSFNRVVEWGNNVYEKAKEIGSNFVNAIIEWFKQLPGRIWNWLSNAANKVIQWKNDLIQKGKEAAQGLFDSIVNKVKEIPGQMLSIGKDIVRGVWEGITGMGSWLLGKVGDFFGGVVDGAKSVLGIHSPSRVMRDEVGKWIPAGVGVGIEEGMPQLDNIMKDSMGDLSNAAKASVTFDGIGLNDSSIGEQIIAKLEQLINKDVVITGEDGQELMRFLAPYQSELEEYSYTRNVKNAY